MRFKQFINEAMDPSFDEAKFEKDCEYYLNLMAGSHQLMFHGSTKPVIPGQIVPFRERGGPTDSPMVLHHAANEYFEKKFGKPFRNGLFVSGAKFIANDFIGTTGKVAIIVPIGKFEWLSSPDISDMTGAFQRYIGVKGADMYSVQQKKDGTKAVMQEIEHSKWLHNEDLPKCLKGTAEVMLWCPQGFYTFTQINLPLSVLA